MTEKDRRKADILAHLISESRSIEPEQLVDFLSREVADLNATDVALYLPDYDQRILHSVPSQQRPEHGAESIDDTPAGQAYATETPVEIDVAKGRRILLPISGGGDRVGVLGFTLPTLDDQVRELLQHIGDVTAEMIITRSASTDFFHRARRHDDLILAAEMQWHLLPPLYVRRPQMAIAGFLEPAYAIGGDAFDYAINSGTADIAIIDAMGHGLQASIMANATIGSYRNARRRNFSLPEQYAAMDDTVSTLFGPERFVTAQMVSFDVMSGLMSWVNAGHPSPLLRSGHTIRRLEATTTLPIGFGGAQPVIEEVQLEPGDRVLFFTDGVVENRSTGGEPFGAERLSETFEREAALHKSPAEAVRQISHTVSDFRTEKEPDDATVLMLDWYGSGVDLEHTSGQAVS